MGAPVTFVGETSAFEAPEAGAPGRWQVPEGRTTPLVPTSRAALVLALAAPVALVIGAARPEAWLVAPLAGLVVLALVFLDAHLAGRLGPIALRLPDDGEVGEAIAVAAEVTVARGRAARMELALACDPRLAAGGRCDIALVRKGGAWSGATRLVPARRGTALVGGVWLRWTGPLGLGARQFTGVLDHPLRIWPNVAAVRSPALQTFLKDAQFGLIARRMRGEGTQFEALAEYQPGMDRRRIDWKASARHVHLYAKENETERNNQIVFAFDCGQAMCEPVRGMPRLDRAVSAALATSYVALKGGDRVALFGFAARPEVRTPFIAGSGAFHRLQRAAAGLEYRAQEPNFTLALATLSGQLQRRSLIVIFSDFTDLTSAQLMIESVGRLLARHVVLFVTLVDDELDTLSDQMPETLQGLSEAVAADLLLRERALVLKRLQQMGVDVIEAPYEAIGPRLIDAYLAIKRAGAIG
ncbi:DUF58 domain-containing protein [Novosphingobium profundi]|uniref:DUF58 domain-containing protein n=1 Tax=Novosphingobium profundi TaxID=1774954 RepID=UPI001BD9F2BA|nr:DUF58 domain-containing protein [Novosphingobium profundi]MBT0667663.1 DUF58 domain-containing protein [Novosphingobium profundi]